MSLNQNRKGRTAAQLLEARLAKYAAEPRRSTSARGTGVTTGADGRQWVTPTASQLLQALGGSRPKTMASVNLAVAAWARGRGYDGGGTTVDTIIHQGLAKATAGARVPTRAGGFATVSRFAWLV